MKALRSLRWKIVFGSLVVQLAVLAMLLTSSLNLISQSLNRQADLRMAEISALLNSAVAPLLASQDHAAIESLFGMLRHDHGLLYLVALDRAGREVARVGQAHTPPAQFSSPIGPGSQAERLDSVRQIELAGQRLGELHFGISTRFMAEARSEMLRQALAISLLAMVFTAVVLALLGSWWTGPLRQLEAAARELAAGGRPPPLRLASQDEVGELSRSFDAMSKQLTERLVELSGSEARMRAIFEQSAVGILFAGLDRRLQRVNDRLARMLGYSAQELVGHDYRSWIAADAHGHDDVLQRRMNQGDSVVTVMQLRRRDGSLLWARIAASMVRTADGEPRALLAVLDDVTESRAAEDRIRHLAFFDPLTALPNRRLLSDRLEHAMRLSARSRQHAALMMLDLDRFKTLNDTRGHAVGDQLLVAVAGRLVACVRESDSVARLGGDEFVLLLEGLGHDAGAAQTHAESVAEKVRAALAEPIRLGQPEHEHHFSGSIGMVMFHGTETSADTLLKQADLALYQAKDAGRNTLRLFDPHMQGAIDARAALESRLRRALQQQEFALHLQPQVDHRGQVIGAEALLRWQPKDGQPVSPNAFIPLAEDTGLILPIGAWVIHEACAMLAAWRGDPQLGGLRLSVNISARQFRQHDFVAQVRDALLHHHAPADRMSLELTETMLHEDVEQTVLRMRQLRDLGLAFSLDDFGTGYSSLSYLKRLPLDQLKIDRSFVRDITTDESDAAIVGAITAMSRSLGLRVIAEGVETEEQRQYLLECGCQAYQGWLYAAAMPLARFEHWVRQHHADRAVTTAELSEAV